MTTITEYRVEYLDFWNRWTLLIACTDHAPALSFYIKYQGMLKGQRLRLVVNSTTTLSECG